MQSKGTPHTTIRLTEADRAIIKAIMARYHLPSVTAAIRHALDTDHQLMAIEANGVTKLAKVRARKGGSE